MTMIRLDKFLTDCGLGSRSEIKKALKQGAALVNQTRETDGSKKIDPEKDQVNFWGKDLTYSRFQYVMFHKPAGCVTARIDNLHKTVMDFLPDDLHKNLSPVGRLDLDTEGLLLLTDDGELAHRLLSPAHHVEKTYYTTVDGPLTNDHIQQFARGIILDGSVTAKPAKLEILQSGAKESACLLTITEGKFHQVKRMFQAVQRKVLYLKRVSMGTLTLDPALAPGTFRMLSDTEISALKNASETRGRKQMLQHKKAVIFDLDGTMADSMHVWETVDQMFFDSHNLAFPPAMQQEIEGMSFSETAAYFVRTFSLDETEEELKALWQAQAMEQYREQIKEKPGLLEFLAYLKDQHMKIGIATSNSRDLLNAFLTGRNLSGYIDQAVTSCEVAAGKPAPDVYLKTAELLQVNPSECLVFEDVPMGILAGKNAGMEVCAVEDRFSADQRKKKRELADYYINDYYEVLP